MTVSLSLGAINTLTGKYTPPKQANKEDKYTCVECGQKVIPRQGDVRAHHFAHSVEDNKCCYYTHPTESQIHKTAKHIVKYVLENKIKLTINRCCKKCNIKYENSIEEICDSSQVHIEYGFKHNGSRKIADVAYTYNNNDDIYCIFEILNTHRTLPENRPEPWFELEASKIIEEYNMCDLKAIDFTCVRNDEPFCENCVNDEIILKNKEIPPEKKGVIYFNQRGAGCGKTFESIQLLQGSDPRFSEKEIFIYLTKMHSAKEVIYNELKDQEQQGKLNALCVVENDDGTEKQYKMTYFKKETNQEITVIIGTIDSFNFAVVDKSKLIKQNDYFKSIVNTIKQGYVSVSSSDNKIRYAGKTPSLNEKCLIIIDEAQDLERRYIDAFRQIIQITNIDVYVIGDKLQSIWGEDNIHTVVDKMNDLEGVPVIKSEGKNEVMRFHNSQFIDFVNGIVPFAENELPVISGICNRPCCYKHENDIIPYEIFQVSITTRNAVDVDEKIDRDIEKIITYMDAEITKYGYLPNNFMFIFPILSRNVLASLLETRIQDFWIKKMNDPEYQEKVLKKSEYWKDRINDNKFYKYIYLHKSDEGKSINLTESNNSSRILSIHSSKGNGCEVVFVLGLTEYSLTVFSKKPNNLVYNSLLHVAITRQKKSIYIGVEENGDDIHKKFKPYEIKKNTEIEPDLNCIRKYIKFGKIREYIKSNEDIFNSIFNEIIEKGKYAEKLPKKENDKIANKHIVDWGHHTIRYSVMIYQFMMNVINHEISIKKKNQDQFLTILRGVTKKRITHHKYTDYNKKIREIDKYNRDYGNEKRKEVDEIPLLLFEANDNSKYYIYTQITDKLMVKIQQKLLHYMKQNKLPPLCPIECIVLQFMINIINNGSYSEITIMDVYSILYCYDSCSNMIDEQHTQRNQCLCHQCFNEEQTDASSYSEIRHSIKNHYENIESINTTYQNYKKYITEHFGKEEMTYNIQHRVVFKDSNEFMVSNEFVIIAYSETRVVYLTIKPQYNTLNFNDVICEIILNHYLILNCGDETENSNRYIDKEIYACILTFDTVEPIFYKIDIDKNNETLKNCIRQYLKTAYEGHNTLLYSFYEFCCKDKGKPKAIKKCLNDKIKLYDKSMPNYVINFFKKIDTDLNECDDEDEMRQVLDGYNTEGKFTEKMNKRLDKSIKELFEG